MRTLTSIVALTFFMTGGHASHLTYMLEKDSHTMSHKDCTKAKGGQLKQCADYNLVVDKANAAIKHCIHTSHHNSAQKTKCISNVVEERDKDLDAIANAKKDKTDKGSKGKKSDPVKKVENAAAAAAKEAERKIKAAEKDEERRDRQKQSEDEKDKKRKDDAAKRKDEAADKKDASD